MNVATRLAILLAVLFFAGVLAATLIPTEAGGGADCGTWVSPEWSEDRVDELVDEMRELAEQDFTGGEFSGRAFAVAKEARENQAACDDALSTRRTVTFVLLGGLVLVPVGVLFVSQGRGRESVSGR